ncbi:phosphoglycerate mutase GpmB [Candidatus Lokiarchaeum ossiferum]
MKNEECNGENEIMMRIIFVRHGESYVNLTGEFSYKIVDKSLTPQGIFQAKKIAEKLKDKQIDFIFSSPLKRAWETAIWISNTTHAQIEVVESFRELNVGDLEKHPPSEEIYSSFMEVWNGWNQGQKDLSFLDGENYYTLLDRMKSGLQSVLTTSHQTVVVVSHGGILTQCIPAILDNFEIDYLLTNDWPNVGMMDTKIEILDGQIQGILIGKDF